MKKIILFLLTIFLVSCGKEAKQTNMSDNPNFNIDFLFEIDGCKIYRFFDYGMPVYFSNCSGNIKYTTGGKSRHDIQTLNNEMAIVSELEAMKIKVNQTLKKIDSNIKNNEYN